MDGEVVESVVGEGFGRGGDDSVIGAVFLSVAEELVDDAGLNIAIRGENGGFDVGGLEDFVNIASNDGFASRASDADELEALGRVTVIGLENLGTGASAATVKLTVIHIYIISHVV